MTSESDSKPTSNTDTGGGANVGGNVDAGNDFVGRDKTEIGTQINNYFTPPTPLQSAENLPPAPGESPYQGMEYFDEKDADRFFGREQLTAELVEYLRHNPLLAIVGASGSGKSSLARAGLIPALKGTQPLIDGSQPPKGSSRWAYHIITPTSHPLESLAASLTRHSESVTATSTLIDDLRKDARSLHLAARRSVSGGSGGDQRLLLLVDQFEELFTLCKDETEQEAFINNLLHATQADGVVTLVLTLRADFYHRCARFPELRNALESQQKYIGAMSRDELSRAIQEPAKAGKWEFQEGVVDQLLNDVGDEPGALPLLSHALLETWKRRSGRRMTLAGYLASGGVQGAIAKSADAIYNAFDEAQQRIARTIFLRLTELGEGSQDTRRRVRPDELKLSHASVDEVEAVLKTLADARLVTTDDNEVQVAHEALIRSWGELREWLDDDREGNRIQRKLTEAANQWVEFGKDANLLYRGVLLQQTQEWQQSTFDPPNQLEMEFFQESQAADKNARRVRRIVTQVLTALTLAALIAAGAAWIQTQRVTSVNRQLATTNEQLTASNAQLDDKNQQLNQTNGKLNNTVTQLNQTVDELDATNGQLQQTIFETQRLANVAFSRQLAAQSNSELGKGRYEPSVLLAIEAGKITDTLESFSSIRTAIANPGHSRLVLYGHTKLTHDVTWSEDESKILTTSDDNTVRIWDINTGKELAKFEGHTGYVYESLWNKTERKILTSSGDGTARIWDANTGKELVKFESHKEAISQSHWNKDETNVLTSGDNHSAYIWNAVSGKEIVRLEGHTGRINLAIWNKDESKILSGSDDNTARIWNAVTGKEVMKFEGHTAPIYKGMWSKDELTVLTLSADGVIYIWNSENGKQLVKIEDNGGSVFQLTWSSDESKILASGMNGSVHIWDAMTGNELIRFEGHTSAVLRAIWNKDESKILTSSADNTARIWDTHNGNELVRLEGHTGNVWQATWSQDETTIITSGDDKTARIWDAKSGKELLRMAGNTVYYAMWNQTESKILLMGDDIRIWDIKSASELISLEGHTAPVNQALWNHDEHTILTSSDDGTARIWNTETGAEILMLRAYTIGSIRQPIWSKDESMVLAINLNVHIWNTEDGQQLAMLDGHSREINHAIWNRDESKVLTSSSDNTARIWDTVSGAELLRLQGHTAPVAQAIWNQDESRILTWSDYKFGDDYTARVWNAADGSELVRLEGHTSSITLALWNEDESKILTCSEDNTVRIWDAKSGKELLQLNGHSGVVYQATWSKDESKILTRSEDDTVRIWDGHYGKELVRLNGHTSYINQSVWNQDESKILTSSVDNTARIWDAATGKELVRLKGHTDYVSQAIWSQDESKILTASRDKTARIWNAVTGKELVRLEGHIDSVTQVTWNHDESKILTRSDDGTVRVWYVRMSDLLVAGCQWVPRNFTWSEWSQYMADNIGDYRPTCPNAPIPPDAIEGIQDQARQQILTGQVVSATQRLEELNGWLQENGQFDSFGINDVQAFVAEVSATATAEAVSSPSVTPVP